MGDNNDVEQALKECFDPLRPIYLLHVLLGYHDYYFHFHSLEHVHTFVEMFRITFDDFMSDTSCNKIEMEFLTKEEYEKRINKEEE